MSSASPFLQFVPNRVESVLRRVGDGIWHGRTALPVSACPPTRDARAWTEARLDPLAVVSVGEAWGRLYDQRWFRVELPSGEPSPDGGHYLEWRDQGEATLYVDGRPYYGFDVAHRFVALPAGTTEVWVEGYCCQSAIWHPDATGLSPRGSEFGGAYRVWRDAAAWEAWNELKVLFDVMVAVRAAQSPAPPPMARFGEQASVGQVTPLYRKVLHVLDRACDAYEVAGLPALTEALRFARAQLRQERPEVRAVLTGHAHIDLVWLWPERMGEAKAVHTFATVDRLLQLYPEFRFAYSQPASYRAVERRAPALAAAVRAHMASGAWQATGAMEVESDTLLPCGEALARSFLLGQAEFERLRGGPARLLWLPDVFGYSGCLPQLMRLAGVEWFFTTKLTWNAVNRFPFSSFVWRGQDGSEVVAHVTQNAGYNNRLDLAELEANARGHAQSHLHAEYLHPTGYGDGGGGPTEEMCERARRLGGLAGFPELGWEHPEAFFSRLAERRDALPVHQGECYLEYHRGTYTTHGELKAAFRGLERALQIREAVASARGQTPDLTAVWRRLVFAQFHDFIPGSSVAEVYAEGVPELQRLAREQLLAARRDLAAGEPRERWFNPLPCVWRGWVSVGEEAAPRWVRLPPLTGCTVAEAATAAGAPAAVHAGERWVDNGRLRAEWTDQGTLKSLMIDGRLLALRAGAGTPVLYPDRPSNYDAWDIDRHSLSLGRALDAPTEVVMRGEGTARAELTVAWRVGRASTLVLRYELRGGEAALRLTAEVDWHETESLLRLHFSTNYQGQRARFGAPFGSALRAQQPGDVRGDVQWEVPGSRWAAVADELERDGLALVTEAKYGFSAREGDLSVSLLRGARITGCDDHRYAAPPGLSRYQPESPFSDQGHHVIRMAIAAYRVGEEMETHPAMLAETLFAMPLPYAGDAVRAGLLDVEAAPTLVPCWARPLGDGEWLLRLHEVAGLTGSARLRLAPGFEALPCGLEGRPTGGAQIDIPYGPYQIVSLRCRRAV